MTIAEISSEAEPGAELQGLSAELAPYPTPWMGSHSFYIE